MGTSWTSVSTLEMLDQAFERSWDTTVILFLHDGGCPTSRYAHHHMMHLAHDIWLIDVQQAHAISAEIARRTGIRHESPQVIVVSGGVPRWSASHGRITRAAVEQALTALSM